MTKRGTKSGQLEEALFPLWPNLNPPWFWKMPQCPGAKIPEMVRVLQDISLKYKIDIGTFGHAGDGNLHPTILTDKEE